jgi:hypothetical protein
MEGISPNDETPSKVLISWPNQELDREARTKRLIGK